MHIQMTDNSEFRCSWKIANSHMKDQIHRKNGIMICKYRCLLI